MAIISGGTQIDPHLRRWVALCRWRESGHQGPKGCWAKGYRARGRPFLSTRCPAAVSIADRYSCLCHGPSRPQPEAIRAIYCTSVFGDSARVEEAGDILWTLGFNPAVFKKSRGEQKAKGVDIALTKDSSNAFRDNYYAAVLVAGDGDYVPLVKEVKSLGEVVTRPSSSEKD